MSTVTLTQPAGSPRSSSWGGTLIIALPLLIAGICFANKFGVIVALPHNRRLGLLSCGAPARRGAGCSSRGN